MFGSKHRSETGEINCNFHGNDTSANPNVDVIAYANMQSTSTQKSKRGLKIFFFNFVSLF